MYTKRPIQQTSEPLRLPEHYSGVAFSKTKNPPPDRIPDPPPLDSTPAEELPQNTEKLSSKEQPQEEVSVPCDTVPVEKEKKKAKNAASLLGLSGREDILLLILALMLLDEDGGDDTLAYILLGLLFLS